MILKQNTLIEKFGNKIGYLFSYLLFTTILFFILGWLNKIPDSWTYFHIMAATLLIALFGAIIKRFLK